ncbi:MAG: type II toxin-antitoxin system RelE/ParE family toxin [Alphaproteobacteria bacterium]|nr:type II toxin-antitoxin system RelE/ParE family toxin [Alphaproteobacteria bacterium]
MADLLRLRAFLSKKDPKAARRAIAILVGAIDSLELFPERGRTSTSKVGRELVVRFGNGAYVIRYIYRRSPRSVTIVRVWHRRERRR